VSFSELKSSEVQFPIEWLLWTDSF